MARADATGDDTELATVIGLYALGELILGEAAAQLDISKEEMRATLVDAGVSLRLGPRDREDAQDEVDVALGTALRDLAVDADIDAVEAVRELRERERF